jgi:hypothetical protein
MAKHKPEPQESIPHLLEELIGVAREQLAVAQESLQNAQAANSTLAALDKKSEKSLRLAQQALHVEKELLESSHRIELLLGSETAPAALRIKYDKLLKGATQ